MSTVREQMAEALKGLGRAGVAPTHLRAWAGNIEEREHYESYLVLWLRQIADALDDARLALDRHRREPEVPCGPECPGYQEGLEAQRERVG